MHRKISKRVKKEDSKHFHNCINNNEILDNIMGEKNDEIEYLKFYLKRGFFHRNFKTY